MTSESVRIGSTLVCILLAKHLMCCLISRSTTLRWAESSQRDIRNRLQLPEDSAFPCVVEVASLISHLNRTRRLWSRRSSGRPRVEITSQILVNTFPELW